MANPRLAAFMRDQYESMWRDDVFAGGVSSLAAPALLREMAMPEGPEGGAGGAGEVFLRRATVMQYIAETLSIIAHEECGDPTRPPAAAPDGHSLQIARLWECIAWLEGLGSGDHSLLHAAALYELAGRQEGAACLSRRFDRRAGLRAPDLARIVSALLQRRFGKVCRACLPLTREPSGEEDEEPPDMLHALCMAVAARAVLSLVGCLLSGSCDRLGEARDGIRVAERAFTEFGFYGESSLMHIVRCVSGPMARNSMWSVLRGEKREGFAWKRYAMLLARGPGRGRRGRAGEEGPPQRSGRPRGRPSRAACSTRAAR